MQNIIDDIKRAKDNNDFLHIKSFSNNNHSWENIINIINDKYHEVKNGFNPPDQRFVRRKDSSPTEILIYNKLDPVIFSTMFGGSKNDKNKIAEDFIELADTAAKSWSIKTIVNFVGDEAGYYAHKDDRDVISWQYLNSVEYRLYEDDGTDYSKPVDTEGKKYTSVILNQGDIIFVPKGMIHQAVVHEPRATFILDMWDTQ